MRDVLGTPRTVQKYSGGCSYTYNGYWITLTKRDGKCKIVRGIETRDPEQKTNRGVGPGSSLSKLRDAYPRVECKRHLVAERVCLLTTRKGQERIPTRFVFFDGEIKMVDIGQVGDFG